MNSPVYPDPFNPILLESTSFELSDEQRRLIREVLDISSSDEQFSNKAYDALVHILTGGTPPPPIIPAVPAIISLVPNAAEIGDPSFNLHIHGANLPVDSVIVFAGQDEPTTHHSDSEVSTGVDMSVWKGADVLPVYVRTPDNQRSNTLMFTFTVPTP